LAGRSFERKLISSSKGERVTAPAHGDPIDIEGVTVATVDDKVRLQTVRTWFDPLDMFRQIAPNGVVKKETVDKNLTPEEAWESERTEKPEVDANEHGMTEDVEKHLKELGISPNEVVEGMGCPFAGSKEAAT